MDHPIYSCKVILSVEMAFVCICRQISGFDTLMKNALYEWWQSRAVIIVDDYCCLSWAAMGGGGGLLNIEYWEEVNVSSWRCSKVSEEIE